MKKLFVLILLLGVFFIGKAQVLDTISLKEFSGLKYKQIKALYAADADAIEIIKGNKNSRILASVLYGVSGALSITYNPIMLFPLGVAVIIHSKNTHKNLYNKLLYFERIKYNKDTLKMAIPNDTNSYKFKYGNHVFDISLENFKAFDKDKQLALFNINDTTQYIFDYTKKYKRTKYLKPILSGFCLGSGAFFLGSSVSLFIHKDYASFVSATTIGWVSTLAGIYIAPSKTEFIDLAGQRQVFNNLKLYYLEHKVNPKLLRYIQIRREQFKN
jgi:hypothetical protein